MIFSIESQKYKCNDQVTVSYCIPSYNHEIYITDLLESIEKDAESLECDFEVIVLDDGSEDGTRSMLQQYVEMDRVPVKAIFFENEGISENLNRIKVHCNGHWIRLCASDDLVLPFSTNLMLTEAKPNVHCVISDGEVIDEYNDIISHSLIEYHGGTIDSLSDEKNLPRSIILNYSLAGPCLLINSSVYEFFSYDNESVIDDYYFFVSLVLHSTRSLKFVKGSVCQYRVHSTNTSKTRDVKKRLRNQKAMLHLIKKLSKKNMYKFEFSIKYIEVLTKITFLSIKSLYAK